jgi:hypothetical protein
MGKKLNEGAKKENFLSKENKKSCWHMIPDEVNFCEFFTIWKKFSCISTMKKSCGRGKGKKIKLLK